jgi:hypothetical protein
MEDPFRNGDAVTLLGVLAGGVIAIIVLICVGAWTVASYLSRPAPPEPTNHLPPSASVLVEEPSR